MSVIVRFWGTRGSIPTPGPRTSIYGGNTACVEIRFDDALFICDGGTGLRELGLDLLARRQGSISGHMFFSHCHWDHIQGFPFFTPAYTEGNTFFVYNPHGHHSSPMLELLTGQMSSSDYFPVNFADLGAMIHTANLAADGHGTVAGVAIETIDQTHPGGSYGYSFSKGGIKVAYCSDTELDRDIANLEASIKDPSAARNLPKSHLDFVRDADLLICDSQYTDDEYPSKIGWGHPRATTAVDLAIAAGVKRLALTHHDPMHADADVEKKLQDCRDRAERRGSEITIIGAREGLEVVI